MNEAQAPAPKPSMSEVVLNAQQQAALESMQDWVARVKNTMSSKPYVLQGFAGTGKTTSVRQLLDKLDIPLSRIALVAPTNRAAKVLQNKTGLHCTTIHRLIYLTVAEELEFFRERLHMWESAANFTDLADLIIVSNETSLEDLFLDTGGGTEAEFQEFVESHRSTILKYEGVTLPQDPGARHSYFGQVKKEKIGEYKNEIQKLLQEELKVRKKEAKEVLGRYSLILVDEASMVNETVGADLVGYGVPTIFVGDPFQLPPVKAKPYWHNLKPGSILTKIERQKGEGAGIPLAGERIRNGQRIVANESVRLHPRNSLPAEAFARADQVICGTHKVRERLCRIIRQELGHTTAHPQEGEKVVATYNDRQLGIMNGEIYTVKRSELRGDGKITLMDLEDPYGHVVRNVTAWTDGFAGRAVTQYLPDHHGKFWWGYCITCHQSQGSEWGHVVVCNDWGGDHKDQWLYTAITRASKLCDLVGY